jgi:hypothetical protein
VRSACVGCESSNTHTLLLQFRRYLDLSRPQLSMYMYITCSYGERYENQAPVSTAYALYTARLGARSQPGRLGGGCIAMRI